MRTRPRPSDKCREVRGQVRSTCLHERMRIMRAVAQVYLQTTAQSCENIDFYRKNEDSDGEERKKRKDG